MSDPSSSGSGSNSSSGSGSDPETPRRPSSPLYTLPTSMRPPSSSSNAGNSLLPPLTTGPGSNPSSRSSSSSSSSSSSPARLPRAIPERCLTFCSQRADAPSMCRMLCLRKKALPATRDEAITRLRPVLRLAAARGEAGAGTGGDSDAEQWTLARAWKAFTPLQSLQRRLSPYSIVYVRGTADGVVGRYMEEMEADDGHADFEHISRHAVERRGEDRYMEYLSWGDEGSLLHLPITSLLHPLLSVSDNASRIFSPVLGLLSQYRDTFADGSQRRYLAQFTEHATNGGAFTLLGRLWTHHVTKVETMLEERARTAKSELAMREEKARAQQEHNAQVQGRMLQRELERRARVQAAQAGSRGGGDAREESGETDAEMQKGKGLRVDAAGEGGQGQGHETGARPGGLRGRIEEAMERDADEARRRSEARKGEEAKSD